MEEDKKSNKQCQIIRLVNLINSVNRDYVATFVMNGPNDSFIITVTLDESIIIKKKIDNFYTGDEKSILNQLELISSILITLKDNIINQKYLDER